jgi:predicted metalloprotease
VHLLEEEAKDLPTTHAGHVREEVGVVLEEVRDERDQEARRRRRRGRQSGARGRRGPAARLLGLVVVVVVFFVLKELNLLRIVCGGVVILYCERLTDEEEKWKEGLWRERDRLSG